MTSARRHLFLVARKGLWPGLLCAAVAAFGEEPLPTTPQDLDLATAQLREHWLGNDSARGSSQQKRANVKPALRYAGEIIEFAGPYVAGQ